MYIHIYIYEGFAPAAGPLLVGGCLGGCWGSQSGRLGPCLFGFVGLLSCFVLVCLVGVVGLFFCCFFSLLEKDPMWVFFSYVFRFFMDVWSLEVTFSVILVSLGRLWTCLVPGGGPGADVVEMIRSIGPLLAPFWGIFWSKTVMCLR